MHLICSREEPSHSHSIYCVSMENYLTLHNTDVQSEDYSNSFVCCICLDLLYKPVVLACGHISCFWCIHRSMSNRRKSHCPICRHTYNHFPNICWMLHLLLLKIYPIAYKIREQQILGEEKKIGIFSSQIDNHGCELLVNTKVDHLEDSANSSTAVSASASKVGSLQYVEQLESVSLILNNGTPISKQNSVRTVAAMKKKFPENKLNNCKQISIADVKCTACKQLLFNPVVLNCGHGCMKAGKLQAPSEFWRRYNMMFPIIGVRYKCIDCVEAVGFDLCGHCYHTRSIIPGRFNQQHTPEHRLELVKPKNIHDMMVSLVGAELEDGSPAHVMGDNVFLGNQS
ncbi:hypothetical protein Patl1_01603 [Pistacia atlantica]|uniref:Uncharacterized protein n=1 Tax=Pistacia atlantica TaxID=434234 RepID=A0ACC1CCQ9_9ROSI|nr:hypothetical protein Patl1_01603 [Pistacia atlantica]